MSPALPIRAALAWWLVAVPLAAARADVSGDYRVAGRELSATFQGTGSLTPVGAGRYRLDYRRDGAPALQATGRQVSGLLAFVLPGSTPGLTGALAGASPGARLLLVLAPAADGTLQGVWRTLSPLAVVRREVWTPSSAGGAPPPAATPPGGSPPATGGAPGPSAPPTPPALDVGRPDEAVVLRLLVEGWRDGQLDALEARALAAFTKAATGQNQRIVAALSAVLASGAGLTPEARAALERSVRGERPGDVPLDNPVYRLVPGPSHYLEDDALFLVGEGTVTGDTGLRSHSRGYAAKRDGVLFTRHGSRAPHHPAVSTASETDALRAQGPDAALDRAASIAGLRLSQFATFSATARSQAYYDPGSSTPSWAGICQGWTHNALDDRISLLVDPPGAEGARGLWIFGQWISRADLGNAMMGASYSLGIADSVTIDTLVKPDKLVKALAQHVLRSGAGLRVDIWNDQRYGSHQIWNQPIVAGSVEVARVTPQVQEAVVRWAAAHPQSTAALPADAGVRLVRARARWGVETGDDWEGEPAFRESAWNIYMITAGDGRVLRGVLALELTDDGVTGLPEADSDGLPDYMALPRHELTDVALSGGQHWLLDPSNEGGARFRFLVGTVLARGIPEPTRAAFEAEALAAGADPADLAARYPGVANAYAPEQWRRVFEPRLGPGSRFGAVWSAP